MHLTHVQPLAVVAAQDDAAALGTEVDGDHRRHQASSPRLTRRSPGRAAGRARSNGSTLVISTPARCHASISACGAPVSVTIASS